MLPPPSNESALRIGAAALGLFAGMALGLALWWLLARLGATAGEIAPFVFSGMGAGATTGAVFPQAGLALFEGTAHFLAGMLRTERALDELDPGRGRNTAVSGATWLSAAFTFGIGYVLLLRLFN